MPEEVEKVSFVMPGRFVIVKDFEVPQTALNVQAFVQEELRRDTLLPLDDIVYDCFMYDYHGSKRALCIIVKKDMLQKCKSIILNMGVRQAHIDTAMTALANVFNYNHPEEADESVVAIADVGKTNTNLIFMREGNLLYGTCLSELSGSLIDGHIAEKMGIDVGQAEELKESGLVDEYILEEAVSALSAKLAGEILTQLSRIGSQTLDQLFITGGNSILPMLLRYLKEHTGVPVDLLNPLKKFSVSKHVDKVFLEEISERLSLALGGIINVMYSEVES